MCARRSGRFATPRNRRARLKSPKAALRLPVRNRRRSFRRTKSELVTITAGSGLGKSQFLREIIWHVLNKVDDNIGLLFLEESTRRTGLSIMSLAANKPLHLPDSRATDQEKMDAYDKTLGTDRIYLFDHFGSTSVDNIINRVRYLAKALGCHYIFLDHISIVVSAQGSGDERKAIDEL